MNSVKWNNLRLKYHRFTPSGCKDIRIRKFEFVAKIQFLYIVVIEKLNQRQKKRYMYHVCLIGQNGIESHSLLAQLTELLNQRVSFQLEPARKIIGSTPFKRFNYFSLFKNSGSCAFGCKHGNLNCARALFVFTAYYSVLISLFL